jgi:hypothetical protein
MAGEVVRVVESSGVYIHDKLESGDKVTIPSTTIHASATYSAADLIAVSDRLELIRQALILTGTTKTS